jgi:hypothetical protein
MVMVAPGGVTGAGSAVGLAIGLAAVRLEMVVGAGNPGIKRVQEPRSRETNTKADASLWFEG